jgi:UDP-2,4-diacetamido-2,4,6-trideoxy-beta-L-altropyranose hydrolase
MDPIQTNKTQLILRADGNASIGYGHLMRTLAFAVNLKNHTEIRLFIRNPDGLAIDACRNYTINYEDISEIALENEAEYIASQTDYRSIVFLDGYSYHENYQKSVMKNGCFLVCMDDHQDRNYIANCVINIAELDNPASVQMPVYSRLVFGFKYALIRPEFSLEDSKTVNPNQLLICFGGGIETLPFIRKSIEAIKLSKVDFAKIIVVANQILVADINAIILELDLETSTELKHSLNAKAMSDEMRSSSFAICSSSTIAIECRAMGLTTISGYFVDNQINIYKNLLKNKEILPAGNLNDISTSELAGLIVQSTEVPENEQESIFNLSNIKNNYLKLFRNWKVEMDFHLRKAKKEDGVIYLDWANHPDVRRNAISSEPIISENHYKWFNARIENPATLMLIAEWQGKPVGQIRFDNNEEAWEIDYSVDYQFRGKGFGELLIRKGMWNLIQQEKKATCVWGFVKIENLASNQVFMKLRFNQDENVQRSGIELRKFSLRLNTQFLYL